MHIYVGNAKRYNLMEIISEEIIDEKFSKLY